MTEPGDLLRGCGTLRIVLGSDGEQLVVWTYGGEAHVVSTGCGANTTCERIA